MTKRTKKKEINNTEKDDLAEDIVLEEEDLNDAQVVKRLRKRLKDCEEEKRANLDGWQRAKADLANNKKAEAERLTRAGEQAKESFLTDIIPVLDSFDMAFKGEAWEKVDDVWQKGVEYIHNQFVSVLESNGASAYGAVGDEFKPELHDASSEEETDKKEEDGKILKVNRLGYKVGDRVVRPAQVVVARFKKE